MRQILTEWARVGQTRIVNVERIPGGPVTLQLTDVPESEALDLLLRSVTGYMAAQRAGARLEPVALRPHPRAADGGVARGRPWRGARRRSSSNPVPAGPAEPKATTVRASRRRAVRCSRRFATAAAGTAAQPAGPRVNQTARPSEEPQRPAADGCTVSPAPSADRDDRGPAW